MTNEEAKKMLEAKLKCLIAETSGTNYDCNMRLCDGCSLNYEQGNIGEQKQALDMAIKALEQQPCEDCISRQKALDCFEQTNTRQGAKYAIETLPSVTPKYTDEEIDKAQAVEQAYVDKMVELAVEEAKRPKGKWIIKDGKEQGYDIAGIKTWYIQILCDKCGFIKTAIEGHTGQYKYCPNCGAEMEGEE